MGLPLLLNNLFVNLYKIIATYVYTYMGHNAKTCNVKVITHFYIRTNVRVKCDKLKCLEEGIC